LRREAAVGRGLIVEVDYRVDTPAHDQIQYIEPSSAGARAVGS
jgi:hypothetical protein